MTAEPTTILIIAAAAAILYPIGMLALDAVAQPMRLRMADTGRRMLKDPDITSERKEVVHALLDDAYDWKPMVFFVVTIPFAAFRSIWMLRQKSSADAVAAQAEMAGSPSEADPYRDIASTNLVSRDMRTLVVRYILSTSAANPIAALFVWIELLVIALIVAMTQGVDSVMGRLYEMVRLAEEPVMRL